MAFFYPNPPPVFPSVNSGYSVHMIPTFATIVQTSVSGNEGRSARQAYPLWEFELTFERLADATQNSTPDPYRVGSADLQKLCGLFLVTAGQYGRFYFPSPEDSSRVGQAIATGNGTTTAFTIVRSWGSAGVGSTFTEPVGGVQPTPAAKVYLNGVLQSSGYTITNNVLTFTVAPGNGVAITMDFSFYYLCRFLEDVQDFEQFYYHLWQLKTLKFRSVKQ